MLSSHYLKRLLVLLYPFFPLSPYLKHLDLVILSENHIFFFPVSSWTSSTLQRQTGTHKSQVFVTGRKGVSLHLDAALFLSVAGDMPGFCGQEPWISRFTFFFYLDREIFTGLDA